jgi:DNA ligase 1
MVFPNIPFERRYEFLKEAVKGMTYMELVPTFRVTSFEQVLEYHKQFLADGYEGTIIRHGNAGYAINKRDTQLLKYKDFLDIQCEVIDVEPSEKNPKQGVVICKNDKGTFGCGMKFSHAEREEILQNRDQYIGQMAEIRFFEYTEAGVPRFPICVGFRADLNP